MLISRTYLFFLLLAFSPILGDVLFPNRAEIRSCKSQDGRGTWQGCSARQCKYSSSHLQAVTDKEGQNLWEGIGSRLHQFHNSGIYGVIK